MKLQLAITLLKLEGVVLTEKSINDAYEVRAEEIQDKAIDASTGKLVKKYMTILNSLKKAQYFLLESISKVAIPSKNKIQLKVSDKPVDETNLPKKNEEPAYFVEGKKAQTDSPKEVDGSSNIFEESETHINFVDNSDIEIISTAKRVVEDVIPPALSILAANSQRGNNQYISSPVVKNKGNISKRQNSQNFSSPATNTQGGISKKALNNQYVRSPASNNQDGNPKALKIKTPFSEHLVGNLTAEEKLKSNIADKYQITDNSNKVRAIKSITIVGILLLCVGALAYQLDWFDVSNEPNKDHAKSSLFEADSVQLQREIITFSSKFDERLRALKANLKEAEGNTSTTNIEHLESLRLAMRLTQNYLAEGTTLAKFESELIRAQTMLSRQDTTYAQSQQMIVLLHDIKQSYQNALIQLNASLQLYPMQQKALQARANLRATLEKYQLAPPSALVKAEHLMNTAIAMEKAIQYTHTLSNYREATTKFAALLAKIERLQIAKIEASRAQNDFDEIVKKYDLTIRYALPSAELMAEAQRESNEGNTNTATDIYKQAEQSWQQELDQLRVEIKAMKVTAQEMVLVEERFE